MVSCDIHDGSLTLLYLYQRQHLNFTNYISIICVSQFVVKLWVGEQFSLFVINSILSLVQIYFGFRLFCETVPIV